LSALDDPFFGPDVIPIDHCFDHILIGITKTGGHCSHLEGKYLPTDLWWTKPVFDFFDYFNKIPIEARNLKKSDSLTKIYVNEL
jgi:predicted alpha/beta-fold hydrolase